MAANVQKVDLVDIELNSGNIHRSWMKQSIGSADVKGNAFGVRVFRDGEGVTLSSVSVYGYFRDSHGNNIAITTGNTVSGNTAYVVLPAACYNYEGQFCLAIKLIGGGVTGTMRIVDGMVDNTHTGGAVAPTAAVPSYSEILEAYDEMVAATAVANAAIAPEYDDLTFPVAAGTLCIYNGALYQASVAISTSEVWTPAHWTETTFGDRLRVEALARVSGDADVLQQIAPVFQKSSANNPGTYVTYEGALYYLPNGHTANAEWADTTKTAIKVGSALSTETLARASGDADVLLQIAPVFQKTSANAAGTYVTYEGALYYLPNGHTANAEWADTTKTAVKIANEVSSVKSAIDVVEDDVELITTATSDDIGKALKVKTVADGKVTSWEFGESGVSNIVSIDKNIIGADSTNTAMLIVKGSRYTTDIVPRDSMKVGYIKVYREKADITKWVYDNSDGSIDIESAFGNLKLDVFTHGIAGTKVVDLCLFSGQSNMSGRGDASQAITCPSGQGYWWHNNTLGDIIDPVGNESGSTGDMIPAVCKSYYDTTGIPIVACVNAVGGTTISQWLSGGSYYNASVSLMTGAKAYLQANGYTVRKIMMLWNQGENDANDGTTKSSYEASFVAMANSLKTDCGIETFYIIEIGQNKTGSPSFDTIRSAQEELANDYANYVIVSDKFRGMSMYMKDNWHFNQTGLNLTGTDAGTNMGYYEITGIKPLHPSFNVGDYSDQNVADAGSFNTTGWTTTDYGTGLSLNKYTGTEKKINIPANAGDSEGYVVPVNLDRTASGADLGFVGNTYVEEVSIASGVKVTQAGGSSVQSLNKLFYQCTALKKVTSVPTLVENGQYNSADQMYEGCTSITQVAFPQNVKSMFSVCKGCTALVSIPEIPTTCTSLQNAFSSSGVKNIPNIPDSVTTINSICGSGTNDVETVGVIGTGVTNMNDAFRYCSHLHGTVRINSANVNTIGTPFHANAIPNIVFQVPANSTTYNTLHSKYPTATFQTF